MMNLEQLHLFISRLPASSQKVFNLYVIDGFTHPEIAAMLNISEGTSKWYLSTARHTLQEMILNFNKVFK
jgi:RNA polymerase sigma-70 factor (ECF subfamily)